MRIELFNIANSVPLYSKVRQKQFTERFGCFRPIKVLVDGLSVNRTACKFMYSVLFVFLFFVVGGEVCRIGGRWVVNPSGGLESKGTFN